MPEYNGLPNTVNCFITLLDTYDEKEWGMPKYENEGDAGFDLRATEDTAINSLVYISQNEECNSKNYKVISTGIKMEIPEGYQLEIRPRSGLAAKYGISVANTPGTIDSGYRGEIKVVLINLGVECVLVQRGDRIAQAVLMPVAKVRFNVTNELTETDRGEGGFGSTGVE
jgi:dUTP pyrophosphatase